MPSKVCGTIFATILLSLLGSSEASAPAVASNLQTTTTTLVSPPLMAKWSKVAWCETHGNWSHNGFRYDGGLGIMPHNWEAYGGRDYAPAAHLATPEQQVSVAIRINGAYVPDQDGKCRNW